jgi:hypothetical protein
MSHERCFRDSVKNHTRAALQTFFGLDALAARVTHRLEAMGKVHGSLARAGKVRTRYSSRSMRRARRAFGAARRARRGIVALGLRTAAIDDARGDRRAASLRTRERGESR